MVVHAYNPTTQEAEADRSLCKIKASLVYIVIFRLAKVTWWALFFKNQQQQQNQYYFLPIVTVLTCQHLLTQHGVPFLDSAFKISPCSIKIIVYKVWVDFYPSLKFPRVQEGSMPNAV